MKKAKLFTVALIVFLLVITQFGMVSAAPSPDKAAFISGTVQQVSLLTDQSKVEITLIDDKGKTHTVVVDRNTAEDLGLLWFDENGDPQLVETLPASLEIPVDSVLTDEIHHPVANALATFFSEIPGVDYDAIMAAHESGYGFGAIAQALWLTQKMEGDAEVLTAVLEAKETGDYSAFTMEDGSVPANWGQFKKAVLDGDKKSNLGVVMSDKNKDHGTTGNNGNGSGNSNGNGNTGNDNNKDKNKDKSNNGNNGNQDNKGKNKP